MQEDLFWGLKWGISAAVFFSVWVAIVRVGSGTAPFDEMGTSLDQVALFYMCSGVLVGIVLGLLRPAAKASRIGAALVGWVLAILVYAGAYGLFDDGFPWQWSGRAWAIILFVAALVGCSSGIGYWQRHAPQDRVRR